jgi:bifunctional ADP-heptose synthase (sugar kinase/adenylyltransferase)
MLASGMDMENAARLANYAAGVVVAKVGTASVSLEELIAAF